MNSPLGDLDRHSIMGRTLMTKGEYGSGDELMLDNGEAVAVTANSHELHIGCVTITWKAWEALLRRVKQIESAR